MPRMVGWIVLLNGKEIDKVFFAAEMLGEEVKQSLVREDGYHPAIQVERETTWPEMERGDLA